MKFFITGGAGYIGAHLGTALQNAGHQVKIFDDFSNGLERRCSGRFSDVVKGNILDYEFLKKQMGGQDAIVHLAAKKSVEESIEKSDEYYETNVIGSKNVINSMIANGINKIIFSSTAAVYQANDNELIQENFNLKPNSPYGLNKLEIEKFKNFAQSGINRISLGIQSFDDVIVCIAIVNHQCDVVFFCNANVLFERMLLKCN